MNRLLQLLLALLPLLLTPLLVIALAEGVLNFGGGEKDVLLAAPWVIWALIFAISGGYLVFRRWPVRRWVVRSLQVSIALMVVFWGVLLGFNLSGLV